MSKTTDSDDLETTVRNALDSAEEPAGYSDLPNLSVSTDSDGNVRIRALDKRNRKRSVHPKQRDALDAAGVEWEEKEDARFRDGTNPRRLVVTGVEDEEPEPLTDGGDEEQPATTALLNELSARSEDSPTVEDVYDYAEPDATDANGDLIIRFVGDREGGVSFEVTDSSLYQDYYSPDRVMMERFGLSEGVRKALDHLENVADLRSVGNYRYGAFNLDRETGRVESVTIHYADELLGEISVHTVGERMVELANDYVRTDGGDEGDDADPFHPDDLDAEHVQPYGVRVTTPDGEEFEFEVPETFRGMNLNDLLELYRERVAMDGVDDLEPGRWYAEQVEEDHGVNPDDEDGPVVLPDGGQVQPADDDEGYPADPSRDATTVHGVQENTSGIVGLCVLYSVHGLHYRVRLRPVNPLDSETFDRGDAWTLFEWAEVETPEEDAPTVEFEEIHYVPAVVREVVPGPVQVPDSPGHVQ